MKRNKYFVSSHCPWCDAVVGIVNSTSKKSVFSAEICPACQAHLDNAVGNVVLVVDDKWTDPEVQKNNIPIYPFVIGVLICDFQPPSGVPLWQNRFPILPIDFASRIGFPKDMIKAMHKSPHPLVYNMNEQGKPQPFNRGDLMMRPGNC